MEGFSWLAHLAHWGVEPAWQIKWDWENRAGVGCHLKRAHGGPT